MSDRRVVHVGSEGRLWTPAQILALVIGVIFAVLGGVALLRTGGIGTSIFEPVTSVAGLQYTPLLALIEVAFGLLLIAVGAFPSAADGVVFLGVLALAFGLLLVIEPDAFRSSIAAGSAHGWFYVVTGGLAALTGLATPAVLRRRVTYREEDEEVVERPSRPDQGRTQRLDSDDDDLQRTRRLDRQS